jgi:hypothetical protein
MNNCSVVDLRSGNVTGALTAAKRALYFIEKEMLREINECSSFKVDGSWNQAFLERVQVLLVTYYNYGICQQKQD